VEEVAEGLEGNCLIFLPNSALFRPIPPIFQNNPQSRFFSLGDALRDRPATPEVGTFVPNSRRHGGAMAALWQSAKSAKSD
jgi:hypothetical protein